MRVVLAVSVCAGLAGCLGPGDPVLAEIDTEPPRLVSTIPVADSHLALDEPIRVTFSERMDVRSLRPGMTLRRAGVPIPSTIVVPPPLTPDAVEQTDRPWTCSIAAELEPDTAYELVLEDVLTDTEGNQIVFPGIDGGTLSLPYRTVAP